MLPTSWPVSVLLAALMTIVEITHYITWKETANFNVVYQVYKYKFHECAFNTFTEVSIPFEAILIFELNIYISIGDKSEISIGEYFDCSYWWSH